MHLTLKALHKFNPKSLLKDNPILESNGDSLSSTTQLLLATTSRIMYPIVRLFKKASLSHKGEYAILLSHTSLSFFQYLH
jgi:hypothetical protein